MKSIILSVMICIITVLGRIEDYLPQRCAIPNGKQCEIDVPDCDCHYPSDPKDTSYCTQHQCAADGTLHIFTYIGGWRCSMDDSVQSTSGQISPLHECCIDDLIQEWEVCALNCQDRYDPDRDSDEFLECKAPCDDKYCPSL